MNRPALSILLVAAAVLPVQARAQTAVDPSVAAMQSNWQQITGNILAAAMEMKEADYAFRPIATVRTFGELIGHIAGAQFSICAAALGEPARAEDAVEKNAKTKADLVAALKESNTYCARAYTQSGKSLSTSTVLFGSPSTRAGAMVLNVVHDGEHYGNIVTYMRMKGLVPPSSKQ